MTYWKQAFENYTDWREAQFESISYDVCVHCKKIVDAGDEHILVCAKNGISKLPFFDHQGYQVSEKKFEEIYHLKEKVRNGTTHENKRHIMNQLESRRNAKLMASRIQNGKSKESKPDTMPVIDKARLDEANFVSKSLWQTNSHTTLVAMDTPDKELDEAYAEAQKSKVNEIF